MKTIYSIVYTQINSVSRERLNLGMIMLNELGELTFRYSQDKLNLIKKLFSSDAYKLIKSYLLSIEGKLADKGDLINYLEDFRSDYLSYLSKYSNNLIAFTEPQKINLELTEDNFTRLFEKYVFQMPSEKVYQIAEVREIYRIRDNFLPKVEDRVNTNYKLNADKFDFVLFNMSVDMIGKNDIPVLNQFIDFESATPASLEKDINSYISLIKPFELKDGLGKYFIVGDEQSKDKNKQHQIWKHITESTLIKKDILEIVTSNEVDKIEEYLEDHDVKPYFQEVV